jgi:hypothetical protein
MGRYLFEEYTAASPANMDGAVTLKDTVTGVTGLIAHTTGQVTIGIMDPTEPIPASGPRVCGKPAPGGGGVPVAGVTAPIAQFQVNGAIRSKGLKQTGQLTTNGAFDFAPYDISTRRYVVEVGPNLVGTVVKLDNDLLNLLCRDEDGCRMTIVMINWDGLGNYASRTYQLHLSETSTKWRFSDDSQGSDADGVASDQYAWDCHFTDAETSLDASNGREDRTAGFGVLNWKGGDFSDVNTTCRFIFED